MRITTLKLVVLATLFANTAYAFELVTPEEFSQSQDALMLEAELSVPDPLGPMIQLLDPVSLDLKEAVKTSSGLRLANVKIPSGRHKLYISIKDKLGHSAAKEIAFKVE